MTIYTTAAKVAKHDVCPGGTERTAEALRKRGMTMDSRVTMQLILKDLGLCDALFSFCEVEKGSREEADKVIREYSRHVTGLACRFITLTKPDLVPLLAESNKPLNKRFDGIERAAYKRKQFVAVSHAYNQEDEPHIRHWLDVYRIMLSPKADHLAATHGTIAMLDAFQVMPTNKVGDKEAAHKEIETNLVNKLKELLGPCPMTV